MTDGARIKIAASVTALFLAGISAAGLAAGDDLPQNATTAITTPSGPAATDGSASGEPRGDEERYDAEGYAGILEKVLGIEEKTRDALDDVTGLVRELEGDE